MNLITELKAKSNSTDNVKQEIIKEIQTYFDKYLDEGLENFLQHRIGDAEIKERKVFLKVEFWAYHSGCSTTNFYCAGKYWYNPENKDDIQSWYYKGIELRTINEEICGYLTTKLEKRMCELGFNLLSKEKQKSGIGYHDTHFYFGW